MIDTNWSESNEKFKHSTYYLALTLCQTQSCDDIVGKTREKHRKVHFEHSSLLFCYLLFFAQNHRRMSMLFIVRVERHKQIQIFSKHQLRFSHPHRHGEPLLCSDKPEITFLKFSLLSRSMFEQRKPENEQNEQIPFHHHLLCELHDELQKSSSHVNFATRTRRDEREPAICIAFFSYFTIYDGRRWMRGGSSCKLQFLSTLSSWELSSNMSKVRAISWAFFSRLESFMIS